MNIKVSPTKQARGDSGKEIKKKSTCGVPRLLINLMLLSLFWETYKKWYFGVIFLSLLNTDTKIFHFVSHRRKKVMEKVWSYGKNRNTLGFPYSDHEDVFRFLPAEAGTPQEWPLKTST